MGPKFSAGACVQHLAKLRNRMKEEGIAVPPPLPRGMVTTTPSRVYSQPTSGKRRRGSDQEDDDDDEYPSLNPAEDSPPPKPAPKKRKSTKKEPDIKEESDAMPELYDTDDEYGSQKKKASKSKAKVKKPAAKKNTRRKSNSQEAEQEAESTPAPGPRTRGVRKNYAQMQAPIEEEQDVKADVVDDGDEQTDGADNAAAEDNGSDEQDGAAAEDDEVKPEESPSNSMTLANIPEATPTDFAMSASGGLGQHFQGSSYPMTPSSTIGHHGQGGGVNPFNVSRSQPRFPPSANMCQFTNMSHNSQPWNPWGNPMPWGVNPQALHMPNNGYGMRNQARYPYSNIDGQDPQHMGVFTGFNNSASSSTAATMPTLTSGLTVTPLDLGQANPLETLGGVGAFANTAALAASRTNSKDSMQSQDTLMGAPAQNETGGAEELDLSNFNGDDGKWDEPQFDDFVEL